MPALDAHLEQKLKLLASKHLLREPVTTSRTKGVQVERGGKTLISFSCNDYLGLSHHPEVIKAAQEATAAYGAGAGASRLVTGNYPLYDELETILAGYKGTQAACIFGSGYLANLGTIPALVSAGDLIIADKLSHACMLDAARLSGATLMRFAHNNIPHLRMLLSANRTEHHNCLIITETIFSMDGDAAPIPELYQLAEEYDAWLMTDDAHGLGIISSQKAHIQMGTLSKAAGSYGGYVCGSKTVIDYIKTSARSLIYSTGLPPASLAVSIAALKLMKNDKTLGEKALENARYFTALLGLPDAQSTIVPVIVKENEKALELSTKLEDQGFLVSAIRPPTVPEHTARLRFTFSALHEKHQIEAVANILKSEGIPCAS
ncbi:MAG: aminotransferase class I/II-fold pyridoxal phosphate-dependent enzyme [Alphaproteobacteria bacterium]|jgi:8-amino-7-oxononanoate synthase